MKHTTKFILCSLATFGLLGLTTGTGNSASLNVKTGEVPEATGTTSNSGAPLELGARTTIKKDFTVEAVSDITGTGAGGTTDRDTDRTVPAGAGEGGRSIGNTDDGVSSGTGGND